MSREKHKLPGQYLLFSTDLYTTCGGLLAPASFVTCCAKEAGVAATQILSFAVAEMLLIPWCCTSTAYNKVSRLFNTNTMCTSNLLNEHLLSRKQANDRLWI